MGGGIRLDLGCGAKKKPGTLGVDVQDLPGVDHIIDLEKDPLPFPDQSVEYVYSSHFLEHVVKPAALLKEVSRVCSDQAELELWTPYAWSNSAFITDHRFFFAEDFWLHICVFYPDFWTPIYKARWILHEFHYVVAPDVLCYLFRHGIELDFALRHLHNVAQEFCAQITVHRDLATAAPPFRRTFSTSRTEPRHLLRESQAGPAEQRTLARAIAGYASERLPPRHDT